MKTRRKGNFERECIEESCDFEECYEVSDQKGTADKMWQVLSECKNRFLIQTILPRYLKFGMQMVISLITLNSAYIAAIESKFCSSLMEG